MGTLSIMCALYAGPSYIQVNVKNLSQNKPGPVRARFQLWVPVKTNTQHSGKTQSDKIACENFYFQRLCIMSTSPDWTSIATSGAIGPIDGVNSFANGLVPSMESRLLKHTRIFQGSRTKAPGCLPQ